MKIKHEHFESEGVHYYQNKLSAVLPFIYNPLLLLTLITNLVKGQSEIEIKLTIDSDCNCPDSLIIEPGSRFGIYAYTPVPKYSGNYADTLIRELDFRKERKISLEQGTYKFIYTPSDSSKQKSQFYFALNPYETHVHLNCFSLTKVIVRY